MSELMTSLLIKMHEGLLDDLSVLAKQNGRTLHDELIVLFERYVRVNQERQSREERTAALLKR